MDMQINPEQGIPFPDLTKEQEIAYKERAKAAAQVIHDLLGEDLVVTEDDRELSRKAIASDLEKEIPITEDHAPALAHLSAILTKYDHNLIESAQKVQNFVVNRLIEESENEDARIRLRALELLGRTSMARVFSENLNVNVTHKNISDVDAELSELAKRYTDVIDVPAKDITPPEPQKIRKVVGPTDE